MREQTLRWRGGWARLGPWRGSDAVAYVSVGAERPPTQDVVDRCVGTLRDRGYTTVVTSALSPADSLPFVDAGFRVRERLHLLNHALDALAPPNGPTRRAHRRDRPAMLAVDAAGFDEFWRFDSGGLANAIAATPAARVRVVEPAADHPPPLGRPRAPGAPAPAGTTICGYAITGRAGAQGYIQRLAVHPDLRRRGLGRRFVLDGLHWLRRHGARRTLVNTQEGNDAALALYRSCGFTEMPYFLSILGRDL